MASQWLDGVNNSLANFFSASSGNAAKRRKTPERSVEPPTDLSPEMMEWFQDTMAGACASSTSFISQKCVEKFTEIETRFVKNENISTNQQAQIVAAETKIETLVVKYDDLEQKFAAMQIKQTETDAAVVKSQEILAATTTAAAQQSNVNMTNARDLAATDRPLAVCGNLGWDNTFAELSDNFDKVIEATGIDRSTIEQIGPLGNRDKQSCIQVLFTNARSLTIAKLKISSKRHSFTTGKTVWLDVAKTRQELAPRRSINKAFSIMKEVESLRPDALVVAWDTDVRAIVAGTKRICFLEGSSILFTAFGKTRYDEHVRYEVALMAQNS